MSEDSPLLMLRRIYETYKRAERFACPGKSPSDKWTNYALIDFSEASGSLVPGEECFGISSRGTELIGFLISVFGQRHFHMGETE